MAPTFNKFFDWTDKSTQDLYNTITNSIGLVGSGIGSLFGGKAIEYGRRKTILIFNVVLIIAVGIKMIQIIEVIWVGRFI